MAFLLGMFVGGGAVGIGVWVGVFAGKDRPLMIDPWWLNNAERWAWLREYELDDRGEGK